MCTVSIITPVYNVEKYLSKCIKSILKQKFKDFELIIVDDGATDSSGEIADSFLTDSRVQVIHKENGGAPSARNAGIEIARGKYLYFPDSDDWLEENYLQDLVDEADKTGAELVISGFTMEYYEDGKEQTYHVSMPSINYIGKDAVRSNLHKYFNNMMMAVPWNKLYRRDYIEKYNLRFPNIKWDDLHFNMEVIMDIENVAICESNKYHFFRSRLGSETTQVFDGMLYMKRKEQFSHILKVYQHWNVVNCDIMKHIYGYYASRLVQCVQEISCSNVTDKRSKIKEILYDDLAQKAINDGYVDSLVFKVLLQPMKIKSVEICLLMGWSMGLVKRNMASVYYKMKAICVNKAKI